MKKRVFLSIFLIIIMCSAVIGGVFVATTFSAAINPSVTDSGMEIPVDPVDWSGKINILVMGTDKSTQLTDTMVLFQIDGDNKTIKSLSIPRDTRIKYGSGYTKINSVYASKNKELATMQAIKSITGLPINYYVTVGLDGFVNIIDYLGGVDITVDMPMKYNDPAQNLHINIPAGTIHMDGLTAEEYVRFRKGSAGYDGSDTERMRRQQGFLKALINQKLTLSNIARAGSIFNEIKKYVNTNFTLAQVVDLATKMKGIDLGSIQQYEISGYPQTINDISYWIVDTKTLNSDVLPNFK